MFTRVARPWRDKHQPVWPSMFVGQHYREHARGQGRGGGIGRVAADAEIVEVYLPETPDPGGLHNAEIVLAVRVVALIKVCELPNQR